MLGHIEDEARAVAREQPDLKDEEAIIEATEGRLSWGLNTVETPYDADEAALAVKAYRDEVGTDA